MQVQQDISTNHQTSNNAVNTFSTTEQRAFMLIFT